MAMHATVMSSRQPPGQFAGQSAAEWPAIRQANCVRTMAPWHRCPRIGGRALAALLPDLAGLPGPVYAALADAIAALRAGRPDRPERGCRPSATWPTRCGSAGPPSPPPTTQLRADGLLTSRTAPAAIVTRAGRRPAAGPRWRAGRRRRRADDLIDLSCAALPAPGRTLPERGRRGRRRTCRAVPRRRLRPGRAAARCAQLSPTASPPAACPPTPEQILLTNGAQHGLDLMLRLLPARATGCSPSCRPTRARWTRSGRTAAGCVAVPLAAGGGWDVDRADRHAARRVHPDWPS